MWAYAIAEFAVWSDCQFNHLKSVLWSSQASKVNPQCARVCDNNEFSVDFYSISSNLKTGSDASFFATKQRCEFHGLRSRFNAYELLPIGCLKPLNKSNSIYGGGLMSRRKSARNISCVRTFLTESAYQQTFNPENKGDGHAVQH